MSPRQFATLVALLAGAAAPARAAPTVAMNGHLPSASDCASMKALGARAVRMDFNWFQFEPARGNFSFDYLDAAVAAARANGLGVYATVAYTPQWASSVPSCVTGSADEAQRCENKHFSSPTDWTDAVTAVVAHFAGQVECWGIWNEPNLTGFWEGSEDDFVNQIFLLAAAAIRAADPGAKICGPELAGLTASSHWNGKNGTCAFGNCIRNGWELDLAQMLDRVGSQIDVVTQHTYQADAPGVMTALLDGSWLGSILEHDAIRNVVIAHGGANKEFWLTETGWEHGPQGSMADADVATRIVDLYSKQEEVCAGTYSASSNDPWANWTRTYYFHFPYDPGSGWGLLDSSQNPLPEFTALQSWAAGRTSSSCIGPAVPTDAGAPGSDAAIPSAADASLPGPDAAALADASAPTPDARSVADGAIGATDSGWPRTDASTARMDGSATQEVTSGACGCHSSGTGGLAWIVAALSILGGALRRR